MQQKIKFSLPLIISLIFHAFTGLLLYGIIWYYEHYQLTWNSTSPFELSEIILKDPPKIKTVGVENGEKNFTVPVAQSNEPVPNIKMSDLATQNQAQYQLENRDSASAIYLSTNHEMQINALKQLSISKENAEILANANLDIQFLPPDGVNEDELNSDEKIFYSFQKRTYLTYVSSFFRSYNQSLVARPYIKNYFANDKFKLTGRVTFDKEGNIVSVRIMEFAENSEIQKLFEETLSGIKALYNPPKALLDENNEFTVYYRLNVNL